MAAFKRSTTRRRPVHPPVASGHRDYRGVEICGRCGSAFWTPTAVAVRSLFIPSWGDVCLKHYVMALAEFVGFVVAWAMAIGAIVSGWSKGQVVEGLLFAMFVLVFTHGADAVLTYALARKGLHPRRGPTPDAAGREATSAVAVSPA